MTHVLVMVVVVGVIVAMVVDSSSSSSSSFLLLRRMRHACRMRHAINIVIAVATACPHHPRRSHSRPIAIIRFIIIESSLNPEPITIACVSAAKGTSTSRMKHSRPHSVSPWPSNAV